MESHEESSHGVNLSTTSKEALSFVPIVDEHLKPQIGMTFISLEEAEEFYKRYAKCAHFQVRKSSTKYKKGELVSKTYVCFKAGESKKKKTDLYVEVTDDSKVTKNRRCGTVRTECNALIRLKLNTEYGVWVLHRFNEVHNHGLTLPRRVHLLPANRIVSKSKKVLMKQFCQINIPTNKQMAFFENCSGGHNKVGFTERDMRNHERDIREEIRGHDAQMLIDYLKWQQEKNPSFYYKHKTDDDNRLTHCFWVDDIGRLNCKIFGDVVSFDATHNTNRHGMIFVAFVGINYHWQSVFLGCGFIPDETTSSFVWIFERWKEVVGHHPLGMVTDQDLRIGGAIKAVFPGMRHRYCIWHILDKIPKKLRATAFKDKFRKPFHENIWNAESPFEFEEKWKDIIKENELEDEPWLKDIFLIREKWAPVYHKPHFWAGMSSSQSSEGMNAFLKKHVFKKHSLHDFVTIFDRVLARQREGELKENHQTRENRPKLKTLFPMEKQMAEVYTLKIFYIFQDELQHSLLYNVALVEGNDSEEIYTVKLCGKSESLKFVKYSKSNQFATCSCHMFEFVGIPCRHLLAFLKYRDQNVLPDQYVLRRWSRDLKKISMAEDGRSTNSANKLLASRFCELTHLANQVADEGLSSDEMYELAYNSLLKMIEEMRTLKRKHNSEGSLEDLDTSEKRTGKNEITVHEPLRSRTKGRPSGKRLKPIREKFKGQTRKCGVCGKRGVGHDSRNCPKKFDSGSNTQQSDDDDAAAAADDVDDDGGCGRDSDGDMGSEQSDEM